MKRAERNSNLSFAALNTHSSSRLIRKHNKGWYKIKHIDWLFKRYKEMHDLRLELVNAALNGREW